jgi:hypothetical protein
MSVICVGQTSRCLHSNKIQGKMKEKNKKEEEGKEE